METTPTFSDPTTPPEPQPGATPDLAAQCPICHGGPLRFSYDSYGTHAYCDSGCHGEILLPCYIEEAKTLIRKQAAALATSRAETEAARAKAKETAKDFEIAFRLVRKENEALTATLAQREAEIEKLTNNSCNARSWLGLHRELEHTKAARDTALARVRELEAAMDELRRRLNALETDVYKYQNQCDPEEAIPAYITGEIERISKSASDAAARAAGTGEEGQ